MAGAISDQDAFIICLFLRLNLEKDAALFTQVNKDKLLFVYRCLLERMLTYVHEKSQVTVVGK